MPVGRDKSGRFAKGHSGNPTGHPKGNPEVKELLKANSVAAAQKLIDLLECGIEKIELTAAQEILNRTEGRPLDNVHMNVSGNLDIRSQVRQVLMERLLEASGSSTQWIMTE